MSVARSILDGLDDGYRCDDLSGIPLLGNAPTALWVGTPLQDTSGGGIGLAWRFDGTNALYLPDYTFGHVRRNEAFSVAFRFRIDPITGTVTLLKRGDLVAEWQILAFPGAPGFASVQLVIWAEDGQSTPAATADGVSTGVWHAGVAVYDRARVIVYIDGTPHAGDAFTGDVRRSNSFVQIGRQLDSSGNPGQYFTGALDEIYFFSRALTQAEVTALRTDRPFPYGTRDGLAPVCRTIIQQIEEAAADGETIYVQEARNDGGQGRFKRRARETISDVLTDITGQVSPNDGKSYGPAVPLLAGTVSYPGGGLQENDSVGFRYDPGSGKFCRLRSISFTLDSHNYAKTILQWSPDGGLTWPLTGDTVGNLWLNYEAGGAFDPNSTIHNTAWKENNNGNPGANIWICANGDLIMACGGCRDPITGMWGSFLGTDNLGARLFRIRWNASAQAYQLVSVSNAVSIGLLLSTYGLTEPACFEGPDGKITVYFRNDNTEFPSTAPPGYCVSVSTDGGLTLSQPVLLAFDTGAAFACPSTTPFVIQLPGSGDYYFVGNNTAIPGGEDYRWPLVTCRLNTALSVPSPVRGTLTRLRRRKVVPTPEPLKIQFANMTLILGRDGWTLEANLSTRGDRSPADPGHGDAWHHQWEFFRPAAGLTVDPAADYVEIERDGETWNRVRGVFEAKDASRPEEYAVGLTLGIGQVPEIGGGRFTLHPKTIPDPHLSPSAADTALPTVPLVLTLPDPPKGSASVLLGPAGTASVG